MNWKLKFKKALEENNIEESNNLKLKNSNEYYYKYHSFDKDGYSLQNLNNSEVFYSKASSFNDPFDCMSAIDKVNTFNLSCNKSDKEKIINNAIDNTWNNTIKQFSDNFLISCFSEVNDSITMWSHYADKHQGFCVLYSIDKYMIDPIIYSNKRYIIDDKSINDKNSFCQTKLLTLNKSLDWEYEKEWRMKDSTKSKVITVAVYSGVNISESNFNKLKNICKEKEYKLYKGYMDSEFFKINFIENHLK